MADLVLAHKGYYGSVETSIEDKCLHGEILFIRDLITYEGQTVEELESSFQFAVDNYLRTCEEQGLEPEKPFKGSFNVRIGAEQHRDLAIAASKRGISLNDLVKEAIAAVLAGGYTQDKVIVERRRQAPMTKQRRLYVVTEDSYQFAETRIWRAEAKAKH